MGNWNVCFRARSGLAKLGEVKEEMFKKTFDVDLALNKTREITVHGEVIRGSLSPLDFPRRADIEYDEQKGIFTIGFVYIEGGTEDHEVKTGLGVDLVVGKKTGRLHFIRIKCDTLDEIPGKITLTLQGLNQQIQQWEKVGRGPYPYSSSLNLAVAHDFLVSNKSEMAKALEAGI